MRMGPGTCRTWTMLWALLSVAVAPFTCAADASRWTLDDLLVARQKVTQEYATFTQERHSLLLERALLSEGTLHYRAPDLLEQIITSPFPSHIRLDGDVLTLERDGGTTRLSLQQYPAAARDASALRGVLSGDRAALESAFSLSFHGSDDAWSLLLVPSANSVVDEARDTATSESRIEFHGTGAFIDRIEIRRSASERSVMTITPAAPSAAPDTGAIR